MLGEFVVIECYRKMNPDTFTIAGTANVSSTGVVVSGTDTVFSRDIIIGEEVTFGSESKIVVSIASDISLSVDSAFANSSNVVTAYTTGLSDVWNDRFLKKYATALIKLQWGNNLSKFSGIQMPGGVTLDGVRIASEAREEITKIEEDMQQYNVLPNDMIIG
jgi:hypothetical protein